MLVLGGETVVVAYRATASRGEREYTAIVSSTYVREDGDCKLAVHQQTPV